ncbi:MAG TPA: 50S ribosomal protein L13 [Candidatus Saccharimonadales bacterium]|nr:50S ribosomal protein L13 [Candidatus Saccharimonadales bacterium]
MKTYSPKASEISRTWYLVDAKDQVLGRLASHLAMFLQGKHKPGFAAHLDSGDFVVVINASKIKLTGNKLEDKTYYHHSGYPGGIKETSLKQKMAQDPSWVIKHAVAGMLPKNRLSDDRLKRLKVYASSQHLHAGQTPVPLSFDTKESN